MNLPNRIICHAGVVVAAMALGLAARGWLVPPPNAMPEARRSTGEQVAGQGAPRQEVLPVFTTDSDPLAGLPADRTSTLREDLKATIKSKSPLREELRLQALLAESIKSPADLARAFELLDSASDEYFRSQAAMIIALQWAERDPMAVLGALRALKDRQVRQQMIQEVVRLWAAKSPEAALAHVKEQGDLGVRSSALHAIFTELAKRNPAAALKRAREFQEPNFSHGLERSVFGEWLRQDGEAALRFAFEEPDAGRREQFVRAAVEILSYTEPGKAWTLYQSLPPEQKKDPWFPAQLINAWVRKSPDAAYEAIAGMSDSDQRRSLVREIGRYLTFSDEAKARELAAKFSGRDEELFLAGMAESFTYDGDQPKFARAVEIAMSLSDSAAQIQLMRSIGSRWGRVDAPGASEWLATLPTGPLRDAAVGEFVRGAFATDPAAALTWASAISDEGKRERRFDEYFPRWIEKDRAAAETWLNQSHRLSPDDRDALRAMLK
jgi:hypothetical protein